MAAAVPPAARRTIPPTTIRLRQRRRITRRAVRRVVLLAVLRAVRLATLLRTLYSPPRVRYASSSGCSVFSTHLPRPRVFRTHPHIQTRLRRPGSPRRRSAFCGPQPAGPVSSAPIHRAWAALSTADQATGSQTFLTRRGYVALPSEQARCVVSREGTGSDGRSLLQGLAQLRLGLFRKIRVVDLTRKRFEGGRSGLRIGLAHHQEQGRSVRSQGI